MVSGIHIHEQLGFSGRSHQTIEYSRLQWSWWWELVRIGDARVQKRTELQQSQAPNANSRIAIACRILVIFKCADFEFVRSEPSTHPVFRRKNPATCTQTVPPTSCPRVLPRIS